jgi:hypothetical protein
MIFKKKKRPIIGLSEKLLLENKKSYKAKIDTGAESSSIDKTLLEKLEKKKIISYKTVKSALGKHTRPMIILEVEFIGIKFKEKFTIADRSHMKYKILIGKDILKKADVMIDPQL